MSLYNESDHHQIRPDALIVGSTGLNQDGDWQILRSGQMLVVERGTLNVTIVDVSYNTRTSIQEQYKSILQRWRQRRVHAQVIRPMSNCAL
jgi:hypothetical protein